MHRSLKTALLAAVLALPGAAQAGEIFSTPEIAQIDELDIPGAAAWAMRGALGNSGITVGLAAVCATEGPRRVEATAFFGGFPRDRRPVQLAVRTVEGTVERFGPVVSGGPEAGFHSPRIKDAAEAGRFADVAFRPGSLISNGYRSFRNRAGEARNRAVREAFMACIERRPQVSLQRLQPFTGEARVESRQSP